MEGMDLKLIPVVVTHILGRLSMFVPMAGTSWTHSQSKQSYLRVWLASGCLPSPTTHSPPPINPSPYMCHS